MRRAGPAEVSNDENADGNAETENVVAETVEPTREWIHGRFLSIRVKRIFNVLGGKSYEPPPKIERPVKQKKPKVPKLPKEKKPKGTPRSGSSMTMEKLQKAQAFIDELKRDEGGGFAMPVGPISGVTVESLGEVKIKKDFVTQQYILPVGFKTARMYPRLDNLDERTKWLQEITEGPNGEPQFTLTAEEGCEPISAKSATAAWAEVLKRVKAVREARGEMAKKTAISGPEFFGYSLPNIRLMIESLPNADNCKEYVTYADSCAKQEEVRKKREEEKKAEDAAGPERPDAASDEIGLSQGYEVIDVAATVSPQLESN